MRTANTRTGNIRRVRLNRRYFVRRSNVERRGASRAELEAELRAALARIENLKIEVVDLPDSDR